MSVVLSISSVVKLNLLCLNLKSVLLGWTCCYRNFSFLFPRIFPLYLCSCISCSPWMGFSNATEEHREGLKNTGTWLPNHTRFFASLTVFCSLHLMYSPLWNIALLCDLVNLSSFNMTLSGRPSSRSPLNVVWRHYWEHQRDCKCKLLLYLKILAVLRFHIVSVIYMNSDVYHCV